MIGFAVVVVLFNLYWNLRLSESYRDALSFRDWQGGVLVWTYNLAGVLAFWFYMTH